MSEARTILRHSPVYLTASLLNRGAGFLLVVIYTRFLAPSGYGLVGAAMAAGEAIGILLSLQLAEALSRLFFDHAGDTGRADIVATALIGILGLTVVGTGPLLLVAPLIAGFVAGDRAAADAIVIASLAVGCDAMLAAGLHTLRAELRSAAVLGWSGARSAMLLAISGLLVGILDYGALGALVGLLAANTIAAIALGTMLLLRGGRFRWTLFRALIGYGAPLCPAWFADSAAKFVERAAIVQRSGLAAAGLWYLALRLADVLSTLVHGPFAQVFVVRRYQLHRDGSPDSESSSIFSVFLAVMAWGAVALSAIAPEAVTLVSGPSFAAAAPLVPAAVAAVAVFSVTTMVEMRLYLAKRPARITAAVLVSALVHGALAFWAAAQWGVTGVAWARLVATCFRVLCLAVAARGLPGPSAEWWRVFGIAVLAGVSIAACAAMAGHDGWTSMMVRAGIVLTFPLLVLSTPIASPMLRYRLLRRIR